MRKPKHAGRRPHKPLYIRAEPGLAKALDRYLDSLRPRPSRQAAVVAALEDWLRREGFWPPPPRK